MKNMTPSVITDGQIEKAVELYRAMLRKHRSELGSEAVQHALGQPEFVAEMVGVLRKRAETVSDLIVCRVKVDRNCTPQQMLDATGRRQYTGTDVVKTMPRGEGKEAEVCFFKLGRYVNDEELEQEYVLCGLRPADPYSLAAVNEQDPAFADDRPNGTHWKDANGEWCYAAFNCWRDERFVHVHRYASVWAGAWWFAGLRK